MFYDLNAVEVAKENVVCLSETALFYCTFVIRTFEHRQPDCATNVTNGADDVLGGVCYHFCIETDLRVCNYEPAVPERVVASANIIIRWRPITTFLCIWQELKSTEVVNVAKVTVAFN